MIVYFAQIYNSPRWMILWFRRIFYLQGPQLDANNKNTNYIHTRRKLPQHVELMVHCEPPLDSVAVESRWGLPTTNLVYYSLLPSTLTLVYFSPSPSVFEEFDPPKPGTSCTASSTSRTASSTSCTASSTSCTAGGTSRTACGTSCTASGTSRTASSTSCTASSTSCTAKCTSCTASGTSRTAKCTGAAKRFASSKNEKFWDPMINDA